MSLLDRLFHREDPKNGMKPLYDAVIARARAVHWYVEGSVPDTLDGRFDMIAAILSFVLLRLEQEEMRQENVWLTELFIDDMEGQLRQIGVGDVVVSKNLGRMVSALGGRLCTYRDALRKSEATGTCEMRDALLRNLYRGEAVSEEAVSHVETRLHHFAIALRDVPPDDLIKGHLPE